MQKETFPFRRTYIDDVPRGAKGLYAIWYKVTGKCLYVGKAEKLDIRERLHQHWYYSSNEDLNRWIRVRGQQLTFCYLPIKKKDKIDTLETIFIKICNPKTNIQKRDRYRG